MPLPAHHPRLKEWYAALSPWIVAALLCTVIALLWYPSLQASFQFDDWNVIVNEARVQSFAAWAASMPGIRPLLKLSYALNNTLSHEPYGFRIFNVTVHALNAVLVGALFTRKSLQWGQAAAAARWTGLITALIFALHPAQTEAVTYISGRSSSLAGLFSLLSLSAWAHHESSSESLRQRIWLALSCLAMVLAVAVKETALTLPLLFWLWSASNPNTAIVPRNIWLMLVVSIVLLCVALSMPAYQRLLAFSVNIRSIADNLLTQAHALLYLAMQLLRIEHMNIDPQLAVVTQAKPLTLVLSCLWLLLIAWSLWRLRKPSASAFAVLWFLVCLLPTNTLLPRLEVANDRQLYLAIIGPAWWVALSATQLRRAQPYLGGAAIPALLIVLLGALAAVTAKRNEDYATEISFWQTTVAQNPSSARAANNLGMAYAVACRKQPAAAQFERAILLDAHNARARINLMLLQANQLPGIALQHCMQ